MRALTVRPGDRQAVRVEDVPEPDTSAGTVLVRAIALGICGTDREIVEGRHGAPPPGRDRMILGHESLGRVVAAPQGSGFADGDLVSGMVRHPDPVPCASCAAGEPDACRNGRFTERGILHRDGFGSELWRADPERLVRVDQALGDLGVLLEPASVVAKAWEHVDHVARRAAWAPRVALVTGAGPIGLLAALMAAQRGLEVHVLDLVTTGPKPALVRDLGATYHAEPLGPAALGLEPDIAIECTGVPPVVAGVVELVAARGITCLTGLGAGPAAQLDVQTLNRRLVLGNGVVLGSVNANRRHAEAAARALAQADRAWLARLVTRRVPLARAVEALELREHDVKVVVELEG